MGGPIAGVNKHVPCRYYTSGMEVLLLAALALPLLLRPPLVMSERLCGVSSVPLSAGECPLATHYMGEPRAWEVQS